MIRGRLFFIPALIALFHAGCTEVRLENSIRVVMETEMGAIAIEVYPLRAPVTAANFLQYVDEGRFKEASFYRVVRTDNQPYSETKIQVVQGGIGFVDSDLRLEPIIHETTDRTGILHRYGTVSMARREPGTAGSEFFICLKDMPELDFGGRRNPDGQGFAAFGRIIRGMDVVEKIQQLPADEQMLVSPVRISRMARIELGP
jgi:peptidyl-prolyl cis-trans isomerase A (cyclophilin A)